MSELLKPICPYCRKEFTPKMEEELFVHAGGCDTCDYGSGVTGTIEIFCDGCKKLIYKKEINTI